MSETIKDSGSMQEFSTGAHRDASTHDKGDCSLLPMKYVSMFMNNEPVIENIDLFMESRDIQYLVKALRCSIDTVPNFRYEEITKELAAKDVELRESQNDNEKMRACMAHMMLEVAKHYFDGSQKYGRNNWQLSMPVNRYIDSGLRHYLKTIRGDVDEPHYRGFIWNLLCAMWTAENFPEMNYKEEPQKSA